MKKVKNILLLLIALFVVGCSQTIIFEDSQTPKPELNIPNNEIWYTSKDGTVIEPDSSADFGATIVSNTYENGKGVIKFNKDLYTIGQYAFDHKPILTVVLPKTVRVIEKDAFSYTPLKSVVLSDELTSIGAEAFEYCNLETIDFGDFIGDVGEFAFRATSVDAVYVSSLPQWCSIDFGGWDANPLAGGGSKTCLYVNNEKLTTLTFHNGLTEIKPYLFNHCKDLEEVVIHDNITRIGKHAFRYSDVRKVTIGKNVQYIGDSAFNCLSLMEIHCKSLTPPELEKINVFAQLHSSCKIYVPFESLDLYKSAYGWSEYKNQIVTITTSAPYTVGDYYCDGEKEGVVFDVWDNGNSGKILSMTQSASGLQWSSDEAEQKRFLGAESYTDGAANTAKIMAISGWQSKYPAFKWCADLGEGWYLPAKEELELFTLDNTVHNAVNNTLLAKGCTKIYDSGVGECYWSSTELNYQVSSGIYCAWYVYMRDGSTNSSDKSVTNYVRSVTTFGNVPKSEPEPEPEPEDKQFTSAPYAVGDYYNDGTKEGVVFDVWDNGNSGKILSMTKSTSTIQWTSDLTEQNRLIGANSEADGAVNMAVVKAISGWETKYPAFKWCADLGGEWYLPAKEELLTIYNGKDKLNTRLTDELISESCWSSTECDLLTSGEYCAWGVSMYNSSTESTYKRYYKSVRAVATFGNAPKPSDSVNYEMVYVKGGTFTMGATSEQGIDADIDEKPTHSVTLSDYYIGKYEVTQAQWSIVMGNNPSYFKGDNLPVECVSWNDVQVFIQKLNENTGKNFRLPTEAEWEYAARGGNQSKGYKYSGSNTVGDVVWYENNSSDTTHSVGQKKPNELGIYDMSGNVWEWCQDWHGSYSSSSQTNPTGPSSGSNRVVRGGSWNSSVSLCRISLRTSRDPNYLNFHYGFRLVCSPE